MSMTTLAYSRSHYQGALLQACVDLSRNCFVAGEVGCRLLLARLGALANGITITGARRLPVVCAPFLTRTKPSDHRHEQRLPSGMGTCAA